MTAINYDYDIDDTILIETVDGTLELTKLYCGNFSDEFERCDLTGLPYHPDSTDTVEYFNGRGSECVAIEDEADGNLANIVEYREICYADYSVVYEGYDGETYYDDDNRGRSSIQHISCYHEISKSSLKHTGTGDSFIGFEIEKNSIDECYDSGDCIEETINPELYWKIETDSSCGVEAVTHALATNSDYVRSLIKGDWVSNEPTDNRCGGHVTMSISGLSGIELLMLFKPIAGLLFSIWQGRLSNSYCCYTNISHSIRYQSTDKCSAFNLRRDSVEFRLPSRVRTSKQLLARYELFSFILDYLNANKQSDISIDGLLSYNCGAIVFLILDIYNGDMKKANRAISQASDYQKLTDGSTTLSSIQEQQQ